MRRAARASLTLVAMLASVAVARAQDAEKAPETRPAAEERLRELERRVDEQQKTIDELKRSRPVPPPIEAAPDGDEQAFRWGYEDGFFVRGEVRGTKVELRPAASIQLDYRAFPHEKPNDQFLIRRASVGFRGSIGDFAYVLLAAPTRPGIPLVDFYFQWQRFDELKLRFGHFIAPFSIDNGYSLDFRSDFVERPMALGSGNVISPDYRPGAEVLGSIDGGTFNYFLAVQNVIDSNVVLPGTPLVTGRIELNFLGFTIAGAGAWDRRGGSPQRSFPGLTPGQFQFFDPVDIRGWEQRYAIDVDFYRGPFWIRTKFLYAVQERRRVLSDGRDGTDFITQGAYVTVGWRFWGPPPKAPRPAVPFEGWELFSLDLEKKRNKRDAGAEILCRLEWIDLDDARGGRRLAPGGAPATPSTAPNATRVRGNDAKAISVGLNFSPIENVRLMADAVYLRIGDQARAEKAHSRFAQEVLVRAQLDF